MPLDLSRDRLDCLRILSERDAAAFYIRAGNIDLEHIYRLLRQALYRLTIFLRRMSADIYDDFRVVLLQKRDVPLAEQVDTRILQADRIHHTASDLCHTRSRIARPRDICNSLCHDCSQSG